jgi:uncharacterized protein (TIGR03435 family)
MIRAILTAGLLIGISGAAFSAEPSFDVASIKSSAPGTRDGIAIQAGGRFVANASLKLLIGLAWHLHFPIAGGDSWVGSDLWSIEAKAEGASDISTWTPPNLPEAIAVRLRSLLQERFLLKTHEEMRNTQIYRLSVSPGGSRMEAVDPASSTATSFRAGPGAIIGSKATMEQFVTILSRYMDRPVIDKTGLTGLYNAKLQFAPESAPKQLSGSTTAASASDDPSIFTAIQEQLGLKLEAAQEPVEILVIDHAERASAN